MALEDITKLAKEELDKVAGGAGKLISLKTVQDIENSPIANVLLAKIKEGKKPNELYSSYWSTVLCTEAKKLGFDVNTLAMDNFVKKYWNTL